MSVKISIIMAIFNSSDTVVDALISLNNQTYRNYELIVVDGGSTDCSLNLVKSYSSNLTHLVSEKDDGVYDALNKGIKLSTGDVIGFLHSDDILAEPDVLGKVAVLFEDEFKQGVYGDLEYVSRSNFNKKIRHWRGSGFSRLQLLLGWMPPHPTLFVRRRWYKNANVFDTKYRISADYLMTLRLFTDPNFNASYMPFVMVKMRVGGISNRSIGNILKKSKEDYSVICQFELAGVFTLLSKNIRKIGQFWC